jgi:hypothetical protein
MDLAAESVLIGRYMLGRQPPPELQERYVAAHRILFQDSAGSTPAPELRFIHRHPWALPLIDAGAGLLQPESIVRRKVFLMTAILEAAPIYADFFLQPRIGTVKFMCDLAWQSLRAGLKIVIGLPLFLWARRIG